MENKKLKPAFALLFTIFLVGVLFLYAYSILQSNVFSSNLNKLKYMNLQANIHYDYVKDYIENNSDQQIKKLSLDDNRFDLKITSTIDNNTTTYYVIIEAKDDIPIRLSKKIIK